MPLVKAQLLAFLVYTTPALLQRHLQGLGQPSPPGAPGDPTNQAAADAQQHQPDLEQLLPGPCPALKRLVAFDAGELSVRLWEALHACFACGCNMCYRGCR